MNNTQFQPGSSFPRTRIVYSLLGIVFAAGLPALADAAIQYKWLQLVPKGDIGVQAVVRTIVGAADDCPEITIGDDRVALDESKRNKPESGFGSIKLCESFLSAKHTERFAKGKFSDNESELTIPDLSQGVPLTEMIAYGCSGCRGAGSQAECTREDWPLWQVNEHGAQHTSSELPPLVVHLGDIRYANQKSLPDYWSKEEQDEAEGALAGWREEYFDAAKPLLEKGIWINTRGNHESCLLPGREEDGWMVPKKAKKLKDRGSAWFYFFGYDEEVSCKSVFKEGDMVAPFAFDARTYLGTFEEAKWGDQTIRMVVLDTVRTGDSRDNQTEKTKKMYAHAFDKTAKDFMHKDQQLWVLSHIPIYSLNGKHFVATVVLDALNDSELSKHLPKVTMAIAAHRHEAILVNPNVGNPAKKGPVQYVAGHGGVLLSGRSETQLACDRAKVTWKPIGKSEDDAESKTTWAVLRRPNHGYVKADFRDGNARFSMNFYSLAQRQWYGDATVDCESDTHGRFLCPYLPVDEHVTKCP